MNLYILISMVILTTGCSMHNYTYNKDLKKCQVEKEEAPLWVCEKHETVGTFITVTGEAKIEFDYLNSSRIATSNAKIKLKNKVEDYLKIKINNFIDKSNLGNSTIKENAYRNTINNLYVKPMQVGYWKSDKNMYVLLGADKNNINGILEKKLKSAYEESSISKEYHDQNLSEIITKEFRIERNYKGIKDIRNKKVEYGVTY